MFKYFQERFKLHPKKFQIYSNKTHAQTQVLKIATFTNIIENQ